MKTQADRSGPGADRSEYADIMTARKGDVVRFASYALRVESEPVVTDSSITLQGRKSTDGCPLVTKRFMKGAFPRVVIERKVLR